MKKDRNPNTLRERERERESSNLKNNKAITLIALVITIVVLLILAGVTIVTLTGDNGLLQKAQTAKEENEEAKELELIKLAVSAAQVAGEGDLTAKTLNNELKANFNDNEVVFENNGDYYYKGYKIDKQGKIEEGKLLPDEYQPVEYIESTGLQHINTKIYTQTNKTNEYILDFTSVKSNGWTGVNGSMQLQISSDNIRKEYQVKYDGSTGKEEIYTDNTLIYERNWGIGKWTGEIYVGMLSNPINSMGISGYIHKFEVYENSILKRKFIPCYSITTVTDVDGIERPKDTVGLYDTVEGKFYVNKGTGTFGYGMEDGTYVAPQ